MPARPTPPTPSAPATTARCTTAPPTTARRPTGDAYADAAAQTPVQIDAVSRSDDSDVSFDDDPGEAGDEPDTAFLGRHDIA
jgi:hypothetical protein